MGDSKNLEKEFLILSTEPCPQGELPNIYIDLWFDFEMILIMELPLLKERLLQHTRMKKIKQDQMDKARIQTQTFHVMQCRKVC